MVDGASNADIKVGETVRVIDLLYALMLPSANEAAYMLARHVGGTSEHFVDMMNTRAEELGCTGTHFCNPCGLHEEDHYTTARDLYLIAREAMKNDTFTNIIDTVQYRMPKTNMHEERIIFTTNQLIFSSFNPWSYPYNKGIKPDIPRRRATALSATRSTAMPSCIRSCSAVPPRPRSTRR